MVICTRICTCAGNLHLSTCACEFAPALVVTLVVYTFLCLIRGGGTDGVDRMQVELRLAGAALCEPPRADFVASATL